MKFIKENKVAVISIGAIVVSLALLFVPGFAHIYWCEDHFKYLPNGYQFLFNLMVKSEGSGNLLGSGVIGAGIAIFVLMGLAIASFCLSRKSSFFVLLGGLFNFVISILFFSMEASAAKSYTPATDYATCGWVTYVLGAIMLLAAIYAIYVAIKMMKDEIKHPVNQKNQSYSYLKK